MNEPLRRALLKIKSKDEFLLELHWWLWEAKSGIYFVDDIFYPNQPKYRLYLIECLDELIRVEPFEIDRTENKFRIRKDEEDIVNFTDAPGLDLGADDVSVLP